MQFNFCNLLFVLFIPMSISHTAVVGPSRGSSDFERPFQPKIGPKGMPYNKSTSCQTFEKYARFNPNSVVGIKWFVFYYWAEPQPTIIYEFWIPSKKDLKFLNYTLGRHLPARFNWSSTLVVMKNTISNKTSLLEEKGDRGQYLMYSITPDIPKGKLTTFMNIRLRQTGDNKYLGLVYCKRQTAFIMSRLDEVPPQNKLHEEASKLGFRGRKGLSYLYQGHQWMPIHEMDENKFWVHSKKMKMMNIN